MLIHDYHILVEDDGDEMPVEQGVQRRSNALRNGKQALAASAPDPPCIFDAALDGWSE